MNIEFDDHPAVCLHKSGEQKGQPVVHEGKPVSLVPDQWLIRMDGVGIGYCRKEPNGWISIIDSMIEPPVKALIVDKVKSMRGDTAEPQVNQVPKVESEEIEDDDDE